MRIVFRCWMLALAVLLSGCAGIGPGFEQPQVSVTSFGLAPNNNASAPRFAVGIRIVNPNHVALPLKGMSYSVEIDGIRLLNGAKPDLPAVGAYASEDFTIEIAPDLIGSVRLVSELFSQNRSKLTYRFRAKVDVGALLPLNVVQEGEFSLAAAR